MDFRTRVIEWFDRHTVDDVPLKSRNDPMITIKRDHSFHVASNCLDLAREIGMSDEDTLLAEMLGLLHDTGRFPQMAEHGTFQDTRSFDHGERGSRIIEHSGLLDDLPDDRRAAVLDGIRFHNRREIPVDIAPSSLPFARLVRDADKIDIFRVVLASIRDNTIRERLKTALNIDFEGGASPEAVADIMRCETVANAHLRTLADFHLMQVSWVFDLSYAPTRKKIRESGVVESIARLIPDVSDGVREAVDKAAAALADDMPSR